MMRSTYGAFKDAAGIWSEDKYIPLIQLSINIISSITLVKLIGLAGVFIGTILSSFMLWFYSYPKFVYKKLFDKSIKDYAFHMLKSLCMFGIIMCTCYFINKYSINIITSFIICLIIPNTMLFIIFRNTAEFKYYKELFLRLIKSMNKRKNEC